MSRKPNSECQIMVFHPTMKEFSDFSRYIQYMESQGAHRGGVAKIIPPKEWVASHNYDNIDHLLIPAPISQVVTGQKGLFTQYNIQQKAMTVKELRRLANTDKYSSPFHENYEDLERTYWKNITFNPAIYGADISGSLYDKDVDIWNVARLNTILDLIENDTGVKIEGVNTAYLYFGMWKTSFAWHTEDMDLYSINYVHFGAPKSWYAIPPEHGKRLERLACGFFPNSHSTCPAFLRHKMTLISPSVLRQYGIPCNKITQEAGEFMITFPYGYHSGFNHGFNCAESTNFASERWINYGIAADKCRCRIDMVYINMDLFMKSFKPEKYEEWKAKKHEVKLSYTDIPPVPDFDEKPVHWRERIRQIKKEYQSPVMPNTQQSCAKSPIKHCDSASASSSKHQIHSKSSILTKIPQIKIKREPISIPMHSNLLSPKKSPKIDRQDAAKLPEPVPSGSSGCLLVPNTGYQLKMGVVLPDFSLDRDTKMQDLADAPAPHFPTLFDRIKMNRRRASDKNSTADYLFDHKYASEQHISQEGTTHIKKPNIWTPCTSETHCELGSEKTFTPRNKSNSETLSKGNFKHREGPFVKLLDFSQSKYPQESKDSSSKISGHRNVEMVTSYDKKSYNKPWSEEDEDTLSASSDLEFSTDDVIKKSNESVSSESSESESKSELTKVGLSKSNKAMISNRPPLKRRHPVSKKGPSKKSSPTVVLKSVSAESGSSDEERRYSVSERGRPRANKQVVGDVDGYDSLRPKRKNNFKHEKQYNTTVAKLPPHCAICTLFKPYYQRPLISSDKPLPLATLLEKAPSGSAGIWTQPLIPEVNFATSINNPAPLATCELLDKEGRSVLLQCNTCMVQVHASCYGIEKPPENPKAWACDRCSFKAYVAQCCLCYMRGGALKPVNDGLQWAHVLCAVAIPEVFFDDVKRRNGINVRNLSPTRQKLKCTYCKRNNSRNFQSVGTCIQCCAGICAVSFHPTCAHAAGIKMEPGDWPLPVFVYCHRHALQKERAMQTKVSKILPDVEIDQTVYGKHRNGRYYPGRVTNKSSQTFHHVIFEDNSWSDNLFQEDIVNHSFEKDGPLKEGDHVEVLWTDGKVYNSKYVNCKKHQVIAVEFEDGSSCSIKREDVYVNMEDMPKRIKRKLSTATSMSKLDYLESPKKVVGASYVSQRAAYNQKRKSSRQQSDNQEASLG